MIKVVKVLLTTMLFSGCTTISNLSESCDPIKDQITKVLVELECEEQVSSFRAMGNLSQSVDFIVLGCKDDKVVAMVKTLAADTKLIDDAKPYGYNPVGVCKVSGQRVVFMIGIMSAENFINQTRKASGAI